MNSDNSNHLQVGHQLGDFTILRTAGDGGFSVVYVAEDRFLERIVAIKEFLPTSVAARGRDLVTVLPRSDGSVAGFQAGLRSFIREAKLLAQFSHPAIVEVYRVWEQNGTAYIAMRYLSGDTLSHHIRNQSVFSEDELRVVLEPIFDAIELLHEKNVIHRDVSPDNIILADGHPVLLDLGAARVVVGGLTQALTSVLKPGYAPIEQYADDGSLKQGTWTDVYALGGVLYKLATGVTPVQAIGRVVSDPLPSLQQMGGNFSVAFAESVMAALTVFPERRIKTVAELRERLGWHSVSTQLFVTTFRSEGDPIRAEARTQPGSLTASETQQSTPVISAAPILSVANDDDRTVAIERDAYRKTISSLRERTSVDASAVATRNADDERTVVTQGALARRNVFNVSQPTSGAHVAPNARASGWPASAPAATEAGADLLAPRGPNSLTSGTARASDQPLSTHQPPLNRTLAELNEPQYAITASMPASAPPLARSQQQRWWIAGGALLSFAALFAAYRFGFGNQVSPQPELVRAPDPSPIATRPVDREPPTLTNQAPISPLPPTPKPTTDPPANVVKTPSAPPPAKPAPPPAPTKVDPMPEPVGNKRGSIIAPVAPPRAQEKVPAKDEPKRTAPSFNGTWLGDLDCAAATGPDAGYTPAFKRRVTGVVANGGLLITRESSVREEFSGQLGADGRATLTGVGYRVNDATNRWKVSGSVRADASREPLRMDGSVKLEKLDAWTALCTLQLTKE